MSRAVKAACAACVVFLGLAGLGVHAQAPAPAGAIAPANVPASAPANAPAPAPEAASAASAPMPPGMRAMIERARKIREIVAAQPAASAPDPRAQVERIAPPERPRTGAEVGAVLRWHRFNDLVSRTLRAAQPPMDEVRLVLEIDAEGRGQGCAQLTDMPPAPPEVLQPLCGELQRIYFGRKTVGPPMVRAPLSLRIE